MLTKATAGALGVERPAALWLALAGGLEHLRNDPTIALPAGTGKVAHLFPPAIPGTHTILGAAGA
jgi:hypothetical protein